MTEAELRAMIEEQVESRLQGIREQHAAEVAGLKAQLNVQQPEYTQYRIPKTAVAGPDDVQTSGGYISLPETVGKVIVQDTNGNTLLTGDLKLFGKAGSPCYSVTTVVTKYKQGDLLPGGKGYAAIPTKAVGIKIGLADNGLILDSFLTPAPKQSKASKKDKVASGK